MKLLAVCLGRPQALPGRRLRTGIFKAPVDGPVMIGREGLAGDAICNGKYHGGEEQAVLLEGSLTLDWWSAQLGYEIAPGTFGENIVVAGLDNRDVAAGDRLVIGSVVLEATSPRTPCATLAARMESPAIVKDYIRAGRPGIYCRVIEPGTVRAGDEVRHHPFEGPRIGIPEMMTKFGKRLSEEDGRRFLSAPIHADMRAAIEAGKPAKF